MGRGSRWLLVLVLVLVAAAVVVRIPATLKGGVCGFRGFKGLCASAIMGGREACKMLLGFAKASTQIRRRG